MERLLEWSLGTFIETEVNMNISLIDCLKEFMENEDCSCSMDFGRVTPLYVYRMWGGSVAIDEIATGLKELRNQGFMNV